MVLLITNILYVKKWCSCYEILQKCLAVTHYTYRFLEKNN